MRFFLTRGILLIAVGAWIFQANTASGDPPAQVERKPIPLHDSKEALPNLRSSETGRIRQILLVAMQPDTVLPPAIEAEFRRLVSKGTAANTPLSEVRDRLVGLSLINALYTYRDALTAWRQGYAVKSEERAVYEKRLLNLRLVSPVTLALNDTLVASVAARDSVRTNGRKVLYDETALREVIAGLERTKNRVDGLFFAPR